MSLAFLNHFGRGAGGLQPEDYGCFAEMKM
jgi:hypothetical protein